MDIQQIIENMHIYEEEIARQESAEKGSISLSTVQTLVTLYQKAIEYYSAFDDNLYNDVLGRMKALIERPEIDALMNNASEKGEANLKHEQETFKIEDEEDEKYEDSPHK